MMVKLKRSEVLTNSAEKGRISLETEKASANKGFLKAWKWKSEQITEGLSTFTPLFQLKWLA
jgi:hypothetical protein